MLNIRKYISRIILFLISLIIISYFLQDELIKGFNHNVELNSMIVFIFFIGVGLVVKNTTTLNLDQKWLINKFKSQPITDNYNPKLLNEFKKINISEVFFTQRVKENIERVIIKLDSERELIKYIIALLVFLGLIGTFWGLLKTIDSVGLTITNLSIDEENILTNFMNLKEGLNAPLMGMGTAFSSSLFGLAGSLCLGFIDLQGNRAQNDFINMLENKFSNLKNYKNYNHEELGKEYLQALVLQTLEGLNNIEKLISKSEESRKNFESLIIESSKVIVKINNEISLRVGQYNKNEITNIEALRNLEIQLKGIKEQIDINREENTKELAKEIQVLAKTVSLIKK
tara:strand:+ start:278 stop:1306 length:1029 start_codon:yes stop_codon:yes gene_type:complete